MLLYDELHATLFYPTRTDIYQTKIFAYRLVQDATSTFLMEFQDTSKATSAYLSSMGGNYSAPLVNTKDRIECLHKEASNSITKSILFLLQPILSKQVIQYGWIMQLEKDKQE